MSFLRKKKVKFNVEMIVQKLTDVPLLNAVIFAKVRLLDCGSFVGVTLHRSVCSHQVDFMSPCPSQYQSSQHNIRFRVRTISGANPNVHRHSTIGLIDDMALSNNASSAIICPTQIERRHSLSEKSPREYLQNQHEDQAAIENSMDGKSHDEEAFIDEHGNLVPVEENPQPFEFVCYIPYDSKYTGELEPCRCKISLRKEDRAGRTPQKLGFVILNLAEFAGSGSEGVTQSFLLDGYGSSQRQDNSRVHVYIRMQHNSADPLFKVPNSSTMYKSNAGAGSDEDLSLEPYGNWLNPADRKAPPPSPNPITNNGANATTTSSGSNSLATPSTCSASNPIQLDSLYSTSSGAQSGSLSLSSSLGPSIPSSLSTVPGGLGHNMSIRVQKTRRDPGDVIDEVLAENSATLAARKQSSQSTSSGEYESS